MVRWERQKHLLFQVVDPTITGTEVDSETKDKSDEVPEFVYKPLSFEELADLLQSSNFNSLAIKNWHKAFFTECPSGLIKLIVNWKNEFESVTLQNRIITI